MKQVWILNHYAQEPGGVGGTRHFHLAEYLPRYGWEASIIAASVDHATGAQRLSGKEQQRLDVLGGVPFLWVKTPSYRGSGGGRVRNMMAYLIRTLLCRTTVGLPKPDVVIGSSVHPLAAVAGALLARRYKVPFIFEVRDLWPQTLIDMGRVREGSLMALALRKMERWLYLRAARTVVLLPQAWQYIVPMGVSKERVVWVPNGVDLSLYPRTHPSLIESDHDGCFTLMYFGAHGQANGLDTLLQAMQYVQQMPAGKIIHLRLIGDGPSKPALIAQAQALGLKNVIFEGSVKKSQIPSLAKQADAFVITVLNLPQLYRYGISMNKLFDYLAAERPIVIASNAINNPVEEANAGMVVPPDQPRALADAILGLACLPLAERQKMGANGRAYVEKNHGFEELARKLAIELDAVCLEKDGAK